MKHLKLLSLLAALMMGLTFTSCLDNDSDDVTTTYYAVCRFYQSTTGYYFITEDGFRIYPSSSSMTELISSAGTSAVSGLLNRLVMFVYNATAENLENMTSTQITDVSAFSIIEMQDDFEIVEYEGAENDSIDNAPIISLTYNSYTPYFFDEEILVLPINYYIDTYSHYTTLCYYPYEEDDMGDGEVTLYLRHNTGRDTDVSTADATTYEYANSAYYYWYVYFRGFNISDIMLYEIPETIHIVYQQAQNLSLSSATETVYTLEYPY